MSERPPRVAYFPDSFHEVNGVAHTSRHFEDFARRHQLPFLCVRAGDRAQALVEEGSLTSLELPRGWLSWPLDRDLRFDPAFPRHLPRIARTLRAFKPDIPHITGPSEIGAIGALLAHHMHLPLAASWHTNVHEYAARRSEPCLRPLLGGHTSLAAQHLQNAAFGVAAWFYRQAHVLFAPNPELCAQLEAATERPCYLMPRGVDAHLFSPAHRTRSDAEEYVLGFVGRLSAEKNVRLLADIARQLPALGVANARFLIIGQGSEEKWLREHLPGAALPGVLRGPALARAYADMDLFVFPSHTDTFGNVVLEALASGVPAIVTRDGGPSSIVRDGVSGLVATDNAFAAACADILLNPLRHQAMRRKAREQALTASWDSVFAGVYEGYRTALA